MYYLVISTYRASRRPAGAGFVVEDPSYYEAGGRLDYRVFGPFGSRQEAEEYEASLVAVDDEGYTRFTE